MNISIIILANLYNESIFKNSLFLIYLIYNFFSIKDLVGYYLPQRFHYNEQWIKLNLLYHKFEFSTQLTESNGWLNGCTKHNINKKANKVEYKRLPLLVRTYVTTVGCLNSYKHLY